MQFSNRTLLSVGEKRQVYVGFYTTLRHFSTQSRKIGNYLRKSRAKGNNYRFKRIINMSEISQSLMNKATAVCITNWYSSNSE